METNELFILGGGASVRYLCDIERCLFSFLADKFCIGLNFSYKFVETTCTLGIDSAMYDAGRYYTPELHDEIKSLPLVIWKDSACLKNREDNTIFLKFSREYDRNLTNGVYGAMGAGIFALSLGIKLLQDKPNPRIYLLGYDYGSLNNSDNNPMLDKNNKKVTHWYQDQYVHRGTGLVSWYNQTKIDTDDHQRKACWEVEYKPFKDEKKVKIFNVSQYSKIEYFEKISYDEMFNRCLTKNLNQDKLRSTLKYELNNIKKQNNI